MLLNIAKIKNTINDNKKSMKFEDYIVQDNIYKANWFNPLPKKHSLAISATVLLAASVSFILPNTPEKVLKHEVVFSSNTKSNDLTDPTTPLVDSLNLKNQNTKSVNTNDEQLVVQASKDNGAMENYEDYDSEVLISDSDKNIDNTVRALASEKEKSAVIQSHWFVEDIQNGDTIASVFDDLNLPYSTYLALSGNKNIDKDELTTLHPGYKLSFLLDDNNNLLSFVKQIDSKSQIRFYKDDVNQSEYKVVRENLGSHLSDKVLVASDGSIVDAPVAEKNNNVDIPLYKKRGRLVVVNIQQGESFSTAASDQGLTYTEIDQISRLFKGRIQFSRHIQPGDSLRVLFSDDKGEGKINAIEFNLKKLGKISAFRNLSDDKYYDENGNNSITGAFRRFPIDGKIIISSNFNPNRKHPVTGVIRPHNGTDFAVRVGTPVLAPADGVVDIARYSKTAGYYIVLRHRGSYSTVYMHLSKLNVKPGQRVKMGSIIARSGNTGISTGPHLHYELRINDRPVNAMRVTLPKNLDNSVSSKQKRRFAANVAIYKKELYTESLMAKVQTKENHE